MQFSYVPFIQLLFYPAIVPLFEISHSLLDTATFPGFRPEDMCKRAELSDYKGSGYDRGHMAPSADMKWDQHAMIECFYLSNMVPQVGKGRNQGIWKDLEEKVRRWAIARGELFIFTGPVYEGGPKETIGKNKVAVPSHLYKIVYNPIMRKAIAFLMPNEPLRASDMPQYIMPIRDIETETALDFLSALDKQVQDNIEIKKLAGLWN